MDREAWLALRRQGIGGSDIGSVCRLPGAFATPFEVWLDKKGLLPPRTSPEMEWGHRLEPVIAEAYEARTGRRLIEPLPGALLQHPELPWVMATPDRFVEGEPGLVELKTTRSAAGHPGLPGTGWGEEGTDEVPLIYLAQAQWQMLASGGAIQWVDLAVLIAGSELRTGYRVHACPLLQARLLAVASAFWRLLEGDEPPPLDYCHPDAPRLLDLLHRPEPGRVIDAGAELACLAAEWEQAGEAARQAEARRDELRARLAALMGGAELARLPDGRAVSRKVVTVKEHVRAESQQVRMSIRKGR